MASESPFQIRRSCIAVDIFSATHGLTISSQCNIAYVTSELPRWSIYHNYKHLLNTKTSKHIMHTIVLKYKTHSHNTLLYIIDHATMITWYIMLFTGKYIAM